MAKAINRSKPSGYGKVGLGWTFPSPPSFKNVIEAGSDHSNSARRGLTKAPRSANNPPFAFEFIICMICDSHLLAQRWGSFIALTSPNQPPRLRSRLVWAGQGDERSPAL